MGTITMTLWDLDKGALSTISSISPTLNTQLKDRLNEMGFNVGVNVACVRRMPLNGPTVVQLTDTVISLESQLAKMISVEAIQNA